jgi:hypothetical protein
MDYRHMERNNILNGTFSDIGYFSFNNNTIATTKLNIKNIIYDTIRLAINPNTRDATTSSGEKWKTGRPHTNMAVDSTKHKAKKEIYNMAVFFCSSVTFLIESIV